MSVMHPSSRPDRYAVFGNPIAHSKSPRIHSLFATQTGQDIVYDAVLVPLNSFASAVADFQAQGGRGANVTVPFKQEAWALADERSPRAQRAGAVNTLMLRDDGSWYGDTTDGVGLVRDLCVNHGVDLAGRARACWAPAVRHAGCAGAAAGRAVAATRDRQPHACQGSRAGADICRSRYAAGPAVSTRLAGESFDVIINATAAGLQQRQIVRQTGIGPSSAGSCPMFTPSVNSGRPRFPSISRALRALARPADGSAFPNAVSVTGSRHLCRASHPGKTRLAPERPRVEICPVGTK